MTLHTRRAATAALVWTLGFAVVSAVRQRSASPSPASVFPMAVTAAPFAAGDGTPGLAIALEVAPPADAVANGRRKPAPVEMAIDLFNAATGRRVTSRLEQIELGNSGSDGRDHVVSRLPAPPGTYRLRVSLKSADGASAKDEIQVDVPDFARDDLSLSGLILTTKPPANAAGAPELAGLLPVSPTARRAFRTNDRVSAFLRVYQKTSAFLPVKVVARLLNSEGDVFVEDVRPLTGATAGTGTAADYDLELPMFDFPKDEYVLTVEVVLSDKTARRALRFRVEDAGSGQWAAEATRAVRER